MEEDFTRKAAAKVFEVGEADDGDDAGVNLVDSDDDDGQDLDDADDETGEEEDDVELDDDAEALMDIHYQGLKAKNRLQKMVLNRKKLVEVTPAFEQKAEAWPCEKRKAQGLPVVLLCWR